MTCGSGGINEKAREERVNKLSGLQRIGKAVQAIISRGVAADNPVVEGKIKDKFRRRNHQVSDPGVLPEAFGAEVGDVIACTGAEVEVSKIVCTGFTRRGGFR